MKLRITTRKKANKFLAGHERCPTTGSLALCTCGWTGIEWWQHRDTALTAWLEAQRGALRGRLLDEEGVERP